MNVGLRELHWEYTLPQVFELHRTMDVKQYAEIEMEKKRQKEMEREKRKARSQTGRHTP